MKDSLTEERHEEAGREMKWDEKREVSETISKGDGYKKGKQNIAIVNRTQLSQEKRTETQGRRWETEDKGKKKKCGEGSDIAEAAVISIC